MSSLSIGENVKLWLHTKLELPWQGSRVVHAVNANVLNFVLDRWPTLGSDTTLKLRVLTMFLSLRKNQLKDLQLQLQKILMAAKDDSDEWLPIISSLISTMILPEGSHVNYGALDENHTSLEVTKSIMNTLSEVKGIEFEPLETPYLLTSMSNEPRPNPHFKIKKRTPRWSETREKVRDSHTSGTKHMAKINHPSLRPSGAANPLLAARHGEIQRNPFAFNSSRTNDRLGNTLGSSSVSSPLLQKSPFTSANASMPRESVTPKTSVMIMNLEDLNRIQDEQKEQERLRKEKQLELKNEKRLKKRRRGEDGNGGSDHNETTSEKTETKKRSTKSKTNTTSASITAHSSSTAIPFQDAFTKPADLSSNILSNNIPSKPADLSSNVNTATNEFYSRITSGLQTAGLSPGLFSFVPKLPTGSCISSPPNPNDISSTLSTKEYPFTSLNNDINPITTMPASGICINATQPPFIGTPIDTLKEEDNPSPSKMVDQIFLNTQNPPTMAHFSSLLAPKRPDDKNSP